MFILKLMGERDDWDIGFRCGICYQSAAQGPITTPCGHLYCHSCGCTWVRPVHVCPICSAHLDTRTRLLSIRPSGVRIGPVSFTSFIMQNLGGLFIRLGEAFLLGIVNWTANWFNQTLDRRFPDLIYVVEERDNVNGEGSENDNGLNVAAEVMNNVNGEGSGNENGVSETVEMRENTSGEANMTNNGSNGEGEVRDNNGDGSSPTVVHPIGGLIPLRVR